MVCAYLTARRGVRELGIAVPGKDALRDGLSGLWNANALGLLERENRCELDGMTVFLLTEKIRVGRMAGPIIAIGTDLGLLAEIAAGHGVTDLIYVPRTPECLAAYLARHPDSAAVDLRPEDAGATLSAEHEMRAAWFDERYDILAHDVLHAGSKPRYLGALDQRRCRYCGKGAPAVAFRTKAHAFPELIGNKALIDRWECDECNKHFAKMLEDDYAKWTLPMRSMGRVNGKGIPSFKSRDQQLRIDARDAAHLQIRMGESDPRHELDPDRKTFTLHLERQPYVPMGVFKCLVKMALAVMPEPEAGACAHLKRWVLAPAHSFESYPYRPLRLLEQFVPGPLPTDQFQYALLRRREERADCPYLIFVVQFSNVVHQIVLPMHEQDSALIDQGQFELCFFPHTGGTQQHVDTFGRSRSRVVDLSGTDIVRDDQQTLSFRYTETIERSSPGT